jgi:apolipoprotein N-acyltransferase
VFLLPALAWVRSIGDDVWFMLVGTESLFYAAMAAMAALVFRLPAWPLWFGGLWVLMEWARSLVPIGGFPWARAAFSQGESLFTPYAALGGVPLVSFAVALCGALLAQAVLGRRTAPGRRIAPGRRTAPDGRTDADEHADPGRRTEPGRRTAFGGRAALVRRAAPLALALAVPLLGLAVPRPGDEGRTVNIGIVQGNVPGEGMYALGDEPAVVLRNHANETKRLAQTVREGKLPKPDLVVLPENSTDIDPYRDEYARQTIHDSVQDVGVPTLVGAVVAIGTEHRATRSLVWDPVTGPGDYYDKQRLVPFGEYTPFKDIVLALWERAGLVGRQSVPGDKPGDLKLGPVTIGAVNCYEVAYDDTGPLPQRQHDVLERGVLPERHQPLLVVVVAGPGHHRRGQLLRGRLRRHGARDRTRRGHAARRADQQRLLRPVQPAAPAARHVPAARRRAQPCRRDRRDHRDLGICHT